MNWKDVNKRCETCFFENDEMGVECEGCISVDAQHFVVCGHWKHRE